MPWNLKKLEAYANFLKSISVLCVSYSVVIIVLWMVKGHGWFADVILQFHWKVFDVALPASILILMPALLIRPVRPYFDLTLNLVRYIISGTIWFYSAWYCLNILGRGWFIAGVLLLGFGVTPIAMIGAALAKNWEIFYSILTVVISIGVWKLAGFYAQKSVVKAIITDGLSKEDIGELYSND